MARIAVFSPPKPKTEGVSWKTIFQWVWSSWQLEINFHSHKIPHFDSSLRKTQLPGFSVTLVFPSAILTLCSWARVSGVWSAVLGQIPCVEGPPRGSTTLPQAPLSLKEKKKFPRQSSASLRWLSRHGRRFLHSRQHLAEEGDSSPPRFKSSLLDRLLEGLAHHGAG